MINTIKLFPSVKRSKAPKIVSLVVLSHGDKRGNILGGDNSQCSVHVLLSALNRTELLGTTKVSVGCVSVVNFALVDD